MESPKPRLGTPLADEDEVIHSIRGILGNGIEAFGLRDDAAVLRLPAGPLVVSVDSVVAGVHVDLAFCSPGDVGWKALMGALSDLAAMGASPLGAVVALCVPGPSGRPGPSGSGDGELALGVMEGVAEASAASACPIVGGDLSQASELAVAVTVLGTVNDADADADADAAVAGAPGPVSRSGAQPGDVVLLTGPCGASAAGLRLLRAGESDNGGRPRAGGAAVAAIRAYWRPVARLRQGMAARRGGATAMIDVSDGLALDLHRLADASEVGFALDEVPVAAGATREEALGGGEDYELVFTCAEGDVAGMAAAFAAEGCAPPTPIGLIVPDPGVRTLAGRELGRLGWRHHVG
ncbi:MAG TPA: thiamine-phosphate kinase [Acidimicrobiales bacterium]|nr:thiamine-phosphate kinase [Acidimicrobiales bacterium]